MLYEVITKSLEGLPLTIQNLEQTMVDVLVNVNYLNGEKVDMMLQPGNNP